MTDTQLVIGFVILIVVLAVLAVRQLHQEGALPSWTEVREFIGYWWTRAVDWFESVIQMTRPARVDEPPKPTIKRCEHCGRFYASKYDHHAPCKGMK